MLYSDLKIILRIGDLCDASVTRITALAVDPLQPVLLLSLLAPVLRLTHGVDRGVYYCKYACQHQQKS